jgi:hypothetical protein
MDPRAKCGIRIQAPAGREKENSESVSGSKTDFRLTSFAMYTKMRFSGRMENAGRNMVRPSTY